METYNSAGPRGRGRPRRPLDLPTRVMREFGHELRLARLATGVLELKAAADLVNAALAELYGIDPSHRTAGRRSGRNSPSYPHPVRAADVSGFELGHTALEDQERSSGLEWLRALVDDASDRSVRRPFIPEWLVAAYDLAFAADGYLRDAYDWAVRLEQAYELDVPALSDVNLRNGAFDADFADAPPGIRTHVDALAAAATTIEEKARERPHAEWTPMEGDESSEPVRDPLVLDGELIEPGGYRVVRFRLANTGRVPWRDRVLVPLTTSPAGLRTAPYLPMGDVEPGEHVDIYCPLRVPTEPGTYRLPLKAVWPDGTFCFPNTFLGVLVMVVVPPRDFSAWWTQAG